ncbi:unnamed protein product [Citrullus colocynthis]|uniref:Uncharacterized protein n=1 Tax=Citrullus colocynthis TaxID=252529 RepID=A0ABP0Z157_9ROSI
MGSMDASLVTTSFIAEPNPNFTRTHHCNSLSCLTIAFPLLTLSLSKKLGLYNALFCVCGLFLLLQEANWVLLNFVLGEGLIDFSGLAFVWTVYFIRQQFMFLG